MTKIYRQGDVLLREVKSIPKSAKRQPKTDRVVLAYGEVTGHSHAILDGDTCDVFEGDNERLLSVVGREMQAIRCRNRRNGGTCWIPADADVEQYKDLEAVRMETVHGVILRHEEHLPFVITAGMYEVGGSGKNLTQREYQPQGFRNVAD